MAMASSPTRMPSRDMNTLQPSGVRCRARADAVRTPLRRGLYAANQAPRAIGGARSARGGSAALDRAARHVAAAEHVGARVVRLLAARLGHRGGVGDRSRARASRRARSRFGSSSGVGADPLGGRGERCGRRRRSRRRGCARRPPGAPARRRGRRRRGRPRGRAAGRRWRGRRRSVQVSRTGSVSADAVRREHAVAIGQRRR